MRNSDEPETPIGVKRGDSDGKHHIDRILAWQMGQSVEYKKPNVKTNVSALRAILTENLWAILTEKVYQVEIKTVDQLKRMVRNCWKDINPEVLSVEPRVRNAQLHHGAQDERGQSHQAMR